MAAPPSSKKDGFQILKHAFNDATGRLRVDAEITASDITLDVNLDADNDEVAVADPDTAAHIRVEPNGSINVSTEIDASDGDSIMIVGTENGAPNGIQHTIHVSEAGNIVVNGEYAGNNTEPSSAAIIAHERSGSPGFATQTLRVTGISGSSDQVSLDVSLHDEAGEAFNSSNPLSTNIENGAGVNAVNVQDGGNSITVDAINLDIRDIDASQDSIEVLQANHDNLNLNANIQVSNSDVTNGNPVPISDASGSLTVDNNGTFAVQATQAGTWDINNITGIVSLPTGASTSALQVTGNASLFSIDSKIANDYGVSSNAVRTASQIGNPTGAADFNVGATGVQTLRTSANITRDGNELSYNDGSSDANTQRVSANIQRDGNDLSYNAGTSDLNTVRTSSNITRNGTELSYNNGTSDANTLRVSANLQREGNALSYNDGVSDTNTIRVSSNIQRDGNDLDYNIGIPGADTLRTAAIQANATGAVDYNHGVVGTQTPRVAAVISNETTDADFNAGTTSSATLRVTSNITRNGTELSYNDGDSDANTLRTSSNTRDGDGNSIASRVVNSTRSLETYPNTAVTTGTNTRPAITNTSATILAANSSRKFAYIQNNTGSTAYLKFDVAAVIGEGFPLLPGGMYPITRDNLWTGTIQAIKSGASSVNLDVFEGT